MSDLFEAQKRFKKVLGRLEKATAKAGEKQWSALALATHKREDAVAELAALNLATHKREDAVAELAALKETFEKITGERDSLEADNLALKKVTATVSELLDSAIDGLAEILEA